jgi:ATP-binding cassette subfamily B protein
MGPRLVLLAVVSVLPMLVGQRRVNQRIYQLHRSTTAEQRELHYLQEVIAGPHMAKELRAYGLEGRVRERWRELARAMYGRRRRLYGQADRLVLLSGLVSGVAVTLSYGLVATGAIHGRLTAGDLTALLVAVASIAVQANSLASNLAVVDEHARFLGDYFDLLTVEPRITAPELPVPLPGRLDGGIVFDGVSFTYPSGTRPAMEGLNLRIAPGEMVAVVGDNGAGKSTLVKLLLRFYDPAEGVIRLGGVDLRRADPHAVRERIGVLFQDFATYELSVRDNVALGRIDSDPNDEQILKALEAARAAPVLDGLPDGLDSRVGHLFEGGHDLSGGERQRLALARLLYRDADVWILDEPTAALDAEAEAAVFAELRCRLGDRMGIVISHRFSTVRIADRIVVLAGGRVVEEGTHAELLALGGRYAALFDLQAAGYR